MSAEFVACVWIMLVVFNFSGSVLLSNENDLVSNTNDVQFFLQP